MRVILYLILLTVVAWLIQTSVSFATLINVPSLLVLVLLWVALNVASTPLNPFRSSDNEQKLIFWQEQYRILYTAGIIASALGILLVLVSWNGLALNIVELGISLLPLLYALLISELVVRPWVISKR